MSSEVSAALPGFSLSLNEHWLAIDASGAIATAPSDELPDALGRTELSADRESVIALLSAWAEVANDAAFAAVFHAADPAGGLLTASLTVSFSAEFEAPVREVLSSGGLAVTQASAVSERSIAGHRALRVEQVVPADDGQVGAVPELLAVQYLIVGATDAHAMVLAFATPALELRDAFSALFDEIAESLSIDGPSPS